MDDIYTHRDRVVVFADVLHEFCADVLTSKEIQLTTFVAGP